MSSKRAVDSQFLRLVVEIICTLICNSKRIFLVKCPFIRKIKRKVKIKKYKKNQVESEFYLSISAVGIACLSALSTFF